MKEKDSSTDTSEAESLEGFVEVVAALSDTSVSSTQRQSGNIKIHVSVPPRQEGGKTGVWKAADSGVRRTQLAEKDCQRLMEKNPNLKRNGSRITLPVIGKVWGVLKCQNGEKRNSMAYVVRDQKESLLGRLD